MNRRHETDEARRYAEFYERFPLGRDDECYPPRSLCCGVQLRAPVTGGGWECPECQKRYTHAEIQAQPSRPHDSTQDPSPEAYLRYLDRGTTFSEYAGLAAKERQRRLRGSR